MPSRSCGGAASKPANHVRADPATHLLIRLFGSLEMPPQVGPRSQSHSTTGYASEPFAVRGTFKRPSHGPSLGTRVRYPCILLQLPHSGQLFIPGRRFCGRIC